MAVDQMTADLLRENEALRAELERMRSLLRACADFHARDLFGTKGIYDCLDKHGMFAQSSALALMMMERSLQAADQAAASGDVVAMLRALEDLFGFDDYVVGLVGIEHYRRELPEDLRGRRPTSFQGEFLGPLPE